MGNAFAPQGSKDEPRIELTELGKAVQSEWLGIHGYYPQMNLMALDLCEIHHHTSEDATRVDA